MVKDDTSASEAFTKLSNAMGENRVRRISKTLHHILVKPRTNDDVIMTLKIAIKYNTPIIPRRRWLISPDTSVKSQIVLDLSDMNGIFKIDDENLSVTAGSGVTWKDLNDSLSKRGLSLGVYPAMTAPRVGDWIDMGGAGIGSYTNGFAVDQVRTLEVVLPDGKVINTGFKNVLSNSSGYNLNGLFVGADSTLGIITKITLKLYPTPEEIRPLYYSTPDYKVACSVLHDLTKIKTAPLNISIHDRYHLKSLRLFGRDIPTFDGELINITLSGLAGIIEHDEHIIDLLMEKQGATKVSSENAHTMWKERFFYVESKPAGLTPVFGEALVPVSRLSEMMNQAYTIIKDMDIKGAITGTLCDRSTLLFSPYFLLRESHVRKSALPSVFSERMGDAALGLEGRPTGSSMMRGRNLKKIYGDGINTIRDIKAALDPYGILNPREFV